MEQKKYCLLLFLMIPSLLFAQDSVIVGKIDSARKAFWRSDSLRRRKERDSFQGIFRVSPQVTVFETSQQVIVGPQHLSIKITGFRQERFLEVLLKAGLPQPVIVDQQAIMQLICVGIAPIQVKNMSKSVPKGNSKRSSRDLRLTYAISENDFQTLTKARMVTIQIAYDSGIWTIPIVAENAEKFRVVCTSFK
jgi:hypothetical protein